MTVAEALREYIIAVGGDGLCSDNCGCELSDFVPCGEIPADCVIAKNTGPRDGFDFFMEPESELFEYRTDKLYA